MFSMPYYSTLSSSLLLDYDRDPNWEGPDNESFYLKNLSTQSADWEYRHKPINYNWNQNGYRAPEWDTIDWSNSVILMGCSLVTGVGLDYNDTIASCLERMIEHPVINLGIPAGSSSALHYNTLRLIQNNIKPKAVCVVAPELTRTIYFGKPNRNLGIWYLTIPSREEYYASFYEQYVSKDPNAEIHGYMHLSGIENAWKASDVPCNIWTIDELPRYVDFARDLGHPGIKTAELWANILFKWLTQ